MKLLSNIKKKYKDIALPIKASIWFVFASVLQKGISFLTTPIFTRLLSPIDYGTFSLYQSWYSILFIFCTLNLAGGVFNNGLTKFPEDKNSFTSSLLGLSTTISLVFFFLYFSFYNFWNNLLGLTSLFIVMMFLQILFEPAYLLWSTGQRYEYKYKNIVIVSLLISISVPLTGIVAITFTTHKIEARIISFVIIQVIFFIVIYFYDFFKGRVFFSRKYWKYALKFNIPLIPHYLSMTLLNQSDKIMISKLINNKATAYYSVAYSVAMLMLILTNSINSSLIPYIYKSIKNKQYQKLKSITNKILIFVAILCELVILFGPEIIKLVASEEYYESIWILPPVSTAVFFIFLYNIFGAVELYFEKTNYIMIASSFSAIINIILNYFFIPIYGYVAAGYTTLFCYILFSFIHYIFYKKIIKRNKINELYNIKNIVIISCISVIFMFFVTLLYFNNYLRYLTILLIVIFIVIFRNKIIKISISICKLK